MKKLILITLLVPLAGLAQLTLTTTTNVVTQAVISTNVVAVGTNVVTHADPVFIPDAQFNLLIQAIATPAPYGLGITSNVALTTNNLKSVLVYKTVNGGVSGYMVKFDVKP